MGTDGNNLQAQIPSDNTQLLDNMMKLQGMDKALLERIVDKVFYEDMDHQDNSKLGSQHTSAALEKAKGSSPWIPITIPGDEDDEPAKQMSEEDNIAMIVRMNADVANIEKSSRRMKRN